MARTGAKAPTSSTMVRRQLGRKLRQLREVREETGPHPGLLGGFTVMDFPDPKDPSVVASRWH